ncbi:MAG: hypothetical protein Q4B58_03745, partial [Bacteroidales bacterium]|nr:hypothetical protein [Bacteroidales bacterium]
MELSKDKIYIQLKEDYDAFISDFKKQEFKQFFAAFRRVLESLPKLIMFDVLADDDKTYKLLSGQAYIKGPKFVNSPTEEKPEGSRFCDLLKMSVTYKHPNWLKSKDLQKEEKRLSRDVIFHLESLSYWYRVASVLGSHTGESLEDIKSRAQECLLWFRNYCAYFQGTTVFSSYVQAFLKDFSNKL